MNIDLGDATLQVRLIIKGRRLAVRWKIGAPAESTAKGKPGSWSGLFVKPASITSTIGKADVYMDLMADKQVTLSLQFTDEMGNPVDAPADGFSATFATDNAGVINLTDNGDGTAVAAAVGTLGTANVHVDVSLGGQMLTGDLQINVVAGLAERINIAAGDPSEVTPDTSI